MDLVLSRAAMATDRKDSESALRYLDRAWRDTPSSPQIGSALGRLLIARARFAEALEILEAAARFGRRADIEASIVTALLALDRPRDAVLRIEAALRDFAVGDGSQLAPAARAVASARAHEFPGWIGVSPTLRIVGEIVREFQKGDIEVRGDRGTLLAQVRVHSSQNAIAGFGIDVSSASPHSSVFATYNGQPLLGRSLRFPPDFDLDGRCRTEEGNLVGWARFGWDADRRPEILVSDLHDHSVSVVSEPSAATGRYNFRRTLEGSGLRGNRLTVSARLPSGELQALADTPLLLQPESPPAPQRRRASRRRGDKIDVVIPVYGGRDETIRCIESVLSTVETRGTEIVVVDDASPDKELSNDLQTLAEACRITLLRNDQNMGFAASVNRGFAEHPDRDCIVLNADTVVYGDWLKRLRRAAYRNARNGTATPLSDDGSIVGRKTEEVGANRGAAFDQLAAKVNKGLTTSLPVGVGFCLYIKRACLDAAGPLDVTTFGRGYGEESDFCMRARKRGWNHVLAADVFVHHAGGRSFGKRRAALMERSARLLSLRHRGYDAMVARVLERDPVGKLFRRLDEAQVRDRDGQFALLISLALGGGVGRVVTERSAKLRKKGLVPIVLEPAGIDTTSCQIRIADQAGTLFRYDMPKERAALLKFLRTLPIEAVELHHFLGHDPNLIQSILDLGVPYDIYIHDYVWICPRVTLMRGNEYCGEPPVAECAVCIKEHGANVEGISASALRRRSESWLAHARGVVAPSRDTARRLQQYFPKIKMRIESLEPRVSVVRKPAGTTTGPFRIALIGALNIPKGFPTVLACARDAARRALPLEFVVIGYTQDDKALFETGRVFVTGQYVEGEIGTLIQREGPDVAFFPCKWPETWCFSLTHAIGAGLPILAFDQGAVAERLRLLRSGMLVPPETSVPALNDLLLKIATKARHDRIRSPKSPTTSNG